MKFRIEDRVPFPLDAVYTAQREQLAALAPYLNDIERIDVLEREELADGRIRFLNLWVGSGTDIPAMARSFIKPEMLRWKDFAFWNPADYSCEWSMELGFLPEAIQCSGRNVWTADGDATRCIIEGDIRIDAAKIPGVPRLMAGKLGEAVEKFVVRMIEPNLKKTSEGVANYLRAQQ